MKYRTPYFEVMQANPGEWYWVLVGASGKDAAHATGPFRSVSAAKQSAQRCGLLAVEALRTPVVVDKTRRTLGAMSALDMRAESEADRARDVALEEAAQTIEVGSLSFEPGELGPCFDNATTPGAAGIVADKVRSLKRTNNPEATE